MMAMSNIKKLFGFLEGVKTEGEKISWPNKQDVIITTAIVFILAILASIFFSVVDTIVYRVIHWIIGR